MSKLVARLHGEQGIYPIRRLRTENWCVNGLYHFFMVVSSPKIPLVQNRLLMHIELSQGRKTRKIAGLLTQVTQRSQDDPSVYQCRLSSPLLVLDVVKQRVFSQQSLIQVLKTILVENADFSVPYDLQSVPDVAIATVIQYQETDLALWQRLCAKHNLMYYFEMDDAQQWVLRVQHRPTAKQASKVYSLSRAAGLLRFDHAIIDWQACHYYHGVSVVLATCDDGFLSLLAAVLVQEQCWVVMSIDLVLTSTLQVKLILCPVVPNLKALRQWPPPPYRSYLNYAPDCAQDQKQERHYIGFMSGVIAGDPIQGLIPVRLRWQHAHDKPMRIPSVKFSPLFYQHPLRQGQEVLVTFIEDIVDTPIVIAIKKSLCHQTDRQWQLTTSVGDIIEERKNTRSVLQLKHNCVTWQWHSKQGFSSVVAENAAIYCGMNYDVNGISCVKNIEQQHVITHGTQQYQLHDLTINAQQMLLQADVIQYRVSARWQLSVSEIKWTAHAWELPLGHSQIDGQRATVLQPKQLQVTAMKWRVQLKSMQLHGEAGQFNLLGFSSMQLQAEHVIFPHATEFC